MDAWVTGASRGTVSGGNDFQDLERRDRDTDCRLDACPHHEARSLDDVYLNQPGYVRLGDGSLREDRLLRIDPRSDVRRKIQRARKSDFPCVYCEDHSHSSGNRSIYGKIDCAKVYPDADSGLQDRANCHRSLDRNSLTGHGSSGARKRYRGRSQDCQCDPLRLPLCDGGNAKGVEAEHATAPCRCRSGTVTEE
ncbi:hypothetical protein NTH_03998 [Nitratireductor thuwali]|uniref:Uncharacterized protein n=1 Tax=Nitratireductor thuwali TaxID=2267699 RepID=A0ABY5MQT4_9HYPH|nr:hypothetical protein NTH_03998 [Nitratireductor thuwali]